MFQALPSSASRLAFPDSLGELLIIILIRLPTPPVLLEVPSHPCCPQTPHPIPGVSLWLCGFGRIPHGLALNWDGGEVQVLWEVFGKSLPSLPTCAGAWGVTGWWPTVAPCWSWGSHTFPHPPEESKAEAVPGIFPARRRTEGPQPLAQARHPWQCCTLVGSL